MASVDGTPAKKMRRIINDDDDDDDDDELPDPTDPSFLRPQKASTPEIKVDHDSDAEGLFSDEEESLREERSASPTRKRYPMK
jgi:hypothetical protein